MCQNFRHIIWLEHHLHKRLGLLRFSRTLLFLFFSCKIYLTYFWLFEKFVSCTSALASKDFLATPSNCNARHKRSVIQHHNIKILGQVPTINFFVVCEIRRHTQHVESCLQAITNILSEFINASSFLKRLFLCSHFWLHSPWRKSRQPITAVCKQ